jgi:hypothetical protein
MCVGSGMCKVLRTIVVRKYECANLRVVQKYEFAEVRVV